MINCTVCILTYNEEQNIASCLDSVVGNFQRVFVVDSFSTDNTKSIIQTYDCVELLENKFFDWASQRNWAAKEAKIQSDYILFLDADERVPDLLVKEIEIALSEKRLDCGEFAFEHYFLRQPLRFAIKHPKVVRLFKVRNGDYYTGFGAREYANYTSPPHTFKNSIRHEDLKPVDYWFQKHVNNAKREAAYYIHGSQETGLNFKSFMRNKIWVKLPLTFRPWLYFVTRYVFLGGFLDGRAGFLFCFFQALVYQMQISAILLEHEKQHVEKTQ